jgi:hypothetical protein
MSTPKHPYNGWQYLDDNAFGIFIAISILIINLDNIIRAFTCP